MNEEKRYGDMIIKLEIELRQIDEALRCMMKTY